MRTALKLLTLLTAPLLLAPAACGGDDPPEPGAPAKVTVGLIPIVDVAPIYLGQKKGFFASRNIELTMELAQGGAAIVPAVLSGQYHFGFSNTLSLLVAQTKAVPIRIVCNGANSTGVDGQDFGGLMVRKDSPIMSPADLTGRKFATNTLQNIVELSVRASVKKAGGDPAKAQPVELPFPQMPAALSAGQVDAVFVVEPFQQAILDQGGRRIASSYVDAAPDLVVATYFTSQKLLGENPDLVKRFTEAMKESLRYAQDHPDEVRDIIASYTQIAAEVRRKMTLPKFPAEINRSSLEALATLGQEYKVLTKAPDLNALLP